MIAPKVLRKSILPICEELGVVAFWLGDDQLLRCSVESGSPLGPDPETLAMQGIGEIAIDTPHG